MNCAASIHTPDGVHACTIPMTEHVAELETGLALHADSEGAIWTDSRHNATPVPDSLSGSEAYRRAVLALRAADKVQHGIAHTDLLREALAYATLAQASSNALAFLGRVTPEERDSWIVAIGGAGQ